MDVATNDDRLERTLRRQAELAEEHRARLDAVRTSASLLQRGLESYRLLLARSKALLQEVRSSLAELPKAPAPDAPERAIKAAMAAWDAAVLSSRQGPPARAAITAYVSVCPEPAEIVEGKILAMIVARLDQRDRLTLH
jgi:aryl carrier-like protein